MPHKHKRRGEADSEHFNLPPSEIAKALPVRDTAKPKLGKNGKKLANKKDQNQSANKAPTHRLKNVTEDDTPKAFRRLMLYQQTGRRAPSGLETGERKRKRNATDDETTSSKKSAPAAETQKTKAAAKEKAETPKIMPGERLAEFVARVDREMPLSQMTKSVKSGDAKNKEQHKRTKHEKHLLRLQKGWREDDAKIREKEQEEREEREFEMEDELRQWKEWEIEAAGGKKKAAKKNKKKGSNANGGYDSGDDDPDPWAKLKKRDQERKKNPLEVAQAPPQLVKPREIFKVRGGAKVDVANIPAAVGSLRRREELAGERRNIVEEYRKLMAAKRQ
ncbi:uncharacterized protein N7500_001039 [Penicillium coprophilum]|uniref:uncharacterized protein n=1 Tax=Penicillium coprophilum TaxID=36646 RepID=UPI00238FDA95|nr:uncharacterized protein N7500_001039 [Penicillium coprophilum]KAJ5178340.1 hypothetical protein N7500_001039 [Penicillium coprophilum]